MEQNDIKQDPAAIAPLAKPEEKFEDLDIGTVDLVKNANDGAPHRLHHPINGKPLKTVIFLLGRDSDKFKAIQAAQSQARLKKAQRSGGRSGLDPADMERDGIELLAACTLGWDDLVLNGRVVPFSVENAEAVYAAHPWIKEQVDVAIGDRAVFTKA
jgi:hypothetical protein